MDEHKDKDPAVSKLDSESKVEAADRCESAAQEGEGEGQDSNFTGEANGEDIMVEVCGSDVFIDGVGPEDAADEGEGGEKPGDDDATDNAKNESEDGAGNGVVDDSGGIGVPVSEKEGKSAEECAKERTSDATEVVESEENKRGGDELKENVNKEEDGVVSDCKTERENGNNVAVPGSPGDNQKVCPQTADEEAEDGSSMEMVEAVGDKVDGSENAVEPVEDSSVQTPGVNADSATVNEESSNLKDQIPVSLGTGEHDVVAKSKPVEEQSKVIEKGEEEQDKDVKVGDKDQVLQTNKCFDKVLAPLHSQNNLNSGKQLDLDKQTATGGSAEDPINPNSYTQNVAEGEVTEMDSTVLSNSDFDITYYIDFDDMLSYSGRIDSKVRDKVEEVPSVDSLEALNSNAGVRESTGNDQDLKTENPVTSSAEDKMDIDEQVSLPVGQDKVDNVQLVDEQAAGGTGTHNGTSETVSSGPQLTDAVSDSGNSAVGDGGGHDKRMEVETGSRIVNVDAQLTNGGKFDPAGNEGLVNSNPGVEPTDDSHEVQDMETDDFVDTEERKSHDDKVVKRAALKSVVKAPQAHYQLPPEDEGEFSVSDLVWGKVRSHPWWPGQIFDASDASEKAMKYHKKDSFLVAYFGDQSFAWNEASWLKPFRAHFSLMEKQSNSEAFQNAVNCALEELSRRITLRLACPCIPKDIYDDIKSQVIENAGIQDEASKQDGAEKSTSADSFAPNKLVEYVKALAQSPSSGTDQLELVIAKAQLAAFHHSMGRHELPEFLSCGNSLENDADASCSDGTQMRDVKDESAVYQAGEQISSQQGSYHRRKHNLKAGLYSSKKQRNLSDLMVDPMEFSDGEIGSDVKAVGKLVSPSSGKKRKASDVFADDSKMQEGRKATVLQEKVSVTSRRSAKPSFHIGECIRRAASQMTSSPSILKGNNGKVLKPDGTSDGIDGVEFEGGIQNSVAPIEYSSLDELLSQLHQAALNPKGEYSSLNVIVSFFSDFRNSLISELHPEREMVLGKRKASSEFGTPEAFEFEDMSDTYWTDRVIQNGSEEQPPRKSRKRENQIVAVDTVKPTPVIRRPRKRYSDVNHDLAAEKPALDPKSPAELVMNFSEVHAVPSEEKLNIMFRHFGRIKESQTEVDRESGHARIVFRRCSDAEVAYNSAGKFNIFRGVLVNYQLNYSITENFKPLPLVLSQGEDDATLYLDC